MSQETEDNVVDRMLVTKFAKPHHSEQQHPQGQAVEIVGVSVPFRSLVVLLVKLSFAAIPAAFIVAAAWFILVRLLVGMATH